jgi:hypothetical protein
MGIEPTRDLLDPTLVLKTRGTTRHQSPPQRILIILPDTIVINLFSCVNELMHNTKLALLFTIHFDCANRYFL